MIYETRFLLALVTTWVIEIPVLLAVVRYVFHNTALSLTEIIFAGVFCNALSLPYLWFVLPPYVNAAYYLPIGEILVILVEAVILTRLLGLGWKQAGICSIIMNTESFSLGLFLL